MRLYKSQDTADKEYALESAQDWDEIYEEIHWDKLFLEHRKTLEDGLKELAIYDYDASYKAKELRLKWIELHEAAIARMRETSL